MPPLSLVDRLAQVQLRRVVVVVDRAGDVLTEPDAATHPERTAGLVPVITQPQSPAV